MITDLGMWPEEATAIMDSAMPVVDDIDDYKMHWNGPAEEYPDAMYAILYLTIRPIALKYIDDNIPEAFFREMFV